MDTNRKYQNISIQPPKLPRTSRTIYELPRENLTESDLVKKSTSDRTKRRVAHEAWFPRPVITKPAVLVVAQRKPKKKHVLKKGFFSRVQPCKVRQINETIVLDSARAQHSQSTNAEFDDRVKEDKSNLGELDCDEVPKKRNVFIAKSHSRKEVDERVNSYKRKSGDLDCDEMTKKKQKKNNVDKSINKNVKKEKKSPTSKGLA